MTRPLLAQTYLPPLRPLLQRWIAEGLLDAVEVCPDRYLESESTADHLTAALQAMGAPYAFHFTQLCLGSPDFPTRYDLDRTARLLRRFSPILISDHLSASAVGTFRYDGNLPCMHDEEAVAYVAENVRAVASAFGVEGSLLVENIPCQFDYRDATMSPEAFTLAVVRAADCKLLLDLHNLYVHERNRGLDAEAFLNEVPADAVLEIHLAGGDTFTPSGEYLDGHSHRVPERVFELLRLASRRFSPRLVVIEREQKFDDHQGMRADLERAREAMS